MAPAPSQASRRRLPPIPRRWRRRAYAALTLLLVLACLELGARFLEKVHDPLVGPYQHVQLPDDLGFTPGQVVQHLGRETRINEAGYVGPNRPMERSPETFRLVLLGDSMSFGYGVEYQESWPAILERALDERSTTDVELLDFAVPGYNTHMEMELYRHRAAAFRPDHVLVGFYGNDAAMGERHLPNLWRLCPQDKPLVHRTAGLASERSALVRVTYDLACSAIYDQPGVLFVHQFVIDPEFVGFRCAMGYLAELKLNLDAQGIGLTIIQIPFLGTHQADGDPEEEVQLRLQQWFADNGYHSINLYPGTVGVDTSGHIFEDTHPNALGHELFGRILVEQLDGLGLPADLLRGDAQLPSPSDQEPSMATQGSNQNATSSTSPPSPKTPE